jgi:beta-lactamase class C
LNRYFDLFVMINASQNPFFRLKSLARNLIVLMALFFFTTFVTDRNNGYIRLASSEKNPPSLNVDYLQRSLEGLIPYYDSCLQASVSGDITPGAALAIIYDGEIRLIKGYGVKKMGVPDPVDIHTAFRIGSVSKGFASVLTGIMTQEEVIDWDDPVAPYLPDFHHRDTATFNSLTIREILGQASGFPIHTFTDLLDDNIPLDQIIEQLQAVPFSTKPGMVYSYQNVVYSLIEKILKNTSGRDYAHLLREKILFPLEMKDASSEYVSLIMSGNYAFPHLRTRNSWTPVDNNPRYYATIPASGINASISDMARWLLALTGAEPEVLPADVLEEVFKPVVRVPMKRSMKKSWENAEELSYALGWRVIRVGNKNIVFHGGHVEGFRAEIGFCPEDKVGIVLLFNSSTNAVNDLLPVFFSNLYRDNAWDPSVLQLQKI